MALQLSLTKPGDTVKKLTLSMKKATTFLIELFWDSKHDLDAHALLARNDGAGAKITALEQILSTYNMTENNPEGAIHPNADGSFQTPCGSLHHSGDCRDGTLEGVDETITVNGAKVPAGVNEIPIFVTIHEAVKTKATFAQVKDAGIRIKDEAGNVLGEYSLSDEFGKFNAVQMGCLMLGEDGWQYAPVGTGFDGTFNKVLEFFQ